MDFFILGPKIFIYLFIYFPLISAVNAPTQILVPEGQLEHEFMSLKDNWKMNIGTPKVVNELRPLQEIHSLPTKLLTD